MTKPTIAVSPTSRDTYLDRWNRIKSFTEGDELFLLYEDGTRLRVIVPSDTKDRNTILNTSIGRLHLSTLLEKEFTVEVSALVKDKLPSVDGKYGPFVLDNGEWFEVRSDYVSAAYVSRNWLPQFAAQSDDSLALSVDPADIEGVSAGGDPRLTCGC